MDKDNFEQYMIDVMSSGFLSLAITIGIKTGLCETMCGFDEAATISEIADKAGLKERYVKEWLGAMVAGQVVEVDSGSRLYHIPIQYKSMMTNTMPWMCTAFDMCARRQDSLESCFKLDGPSGYSVREYPEYYTWLNKVKSGMIDDILDKDIIPQLEELQDKLENGITVADVGCGTGNMSLGLARRFAKSTFYGIDYGTEAIDLATSATRQTNVTNATFQTGDAETLPSSWTKRFDMVFVYDVIHDTCHPHKVLSEIHRILKDDGTLSLVECDMCDNHFESRNSSSAAMAYSFSMHSCLPNSLAVSSAVGLGSCCGNEKIKDVLRKTGFFILKDLPMTVESNRHYVLNKII